MPYLDSEREGTRDVLRGEALVESLEIGGETELSTWHGIIQ